MALGQELPNDLVADVLRCLPPRSQAVSRCVCRAWRDLVDDRRLLRADLLPRSVGGIFINYCTHYSPEFLARPTTGPFISGDFEFIPGVSKVMDHCNGLVIFRTYSRGGHDYVANPAAQQWVRLPLPPEPDSEMGKNWFQEVKCLVYDPTVSPHYDVFLIYSIYKVYVYSSRTDRWEESWFAPEGRVVETTIAGDDMNLNKVYWGGALYLLCANGFVLRMSLSNAKYTLIPPPDIEFGLRGGYSLGRSLKGVYCAFEYDWNRLRIFLLKESCGQIVWEIRHSVDLRTFARKMHELVDYGDKPNGPWILQDINYYKYPYGNTKHKEVVEGNFEWNSDDDNILDTEEMVVGYYEGYTGLLGFHSYKEIIYLNASLTRAVAYHWNTSTFQDLGNIYPIDYNAGHVAGIGTSFIYTPCWMEDFPKNSLSAPIEH